MMTKNFIFYSLESIDEDTNSIQKMLNQKDQF
jgi:hypothetical protein